MAGIIVEQLDAKEIGVTIVRRFSLPCSIN
jgi:hypothetical protein